MKALVSFSFFAGLSVALPQSASQNATKIPKAAPTGDNVCVGFREDVDLLKEDCVGTNAYCIHKYYKNFDEDYKDSFACLGHRGIDPDSLRSEGVDRHVWDVELRDHGLTELLLANHNYVRYLLLDRLSQTVGSPELKHQPETQKVQESTANKEDIKTEALTGINVAKQNFMQAYDALFAKEISDLIDEAVRNRTREWTESRTDQLAQIQTRLEVSTWLKKANELFTRYKLIDRLNLQGFDNDAIFVEARASLQKALEIASPDEKEAIDRARAALIPAWEQALSIDILHQAVQVIIGRQVKW